MRVMKKVIIIMSGLASLYIVSNLKFGSIDITPLVTFSNNYVPCKAEYNRFKSLNTTEFCTEFPSVPADVKKVIDWHPHDEQYKKCILLIAIKLYNRQIVMNHQTFELREGRSFYWNRFGSDNSILRAFSEILGDNIVQSKLGGEFLNPSMAFNYIEKHPEYLKYPEIKPIYSFSDSLSNELGR